MNACISADSTIIPSSTIPLCNCYTQYSGFKDGFLDCTIFADSFDVTVVNLQA